MLIGAYGVFWAREEVDWSPGRGKSWDLLGRRGARADALQLADFRRARGVYILFDDYGAYYVGLARGAGGIGGRLQDHTQDEHRDHWSRFCWFSFDAVDTKTSLRGIRQLRPRDRPVPSSQRQVIGELEALLITLLNTRNINAMRFREAESWEQVSWWDRDKLFDRLQY